MENILKYQEYEKLLNNPLWHLCRSNTENAISNFWAYLIQATGETSVILGKKYHQKIDKQKVFASREKSHADFLLDLGNKILIIENKTKSLPSDIQVKKYADNLIKKKEYKNKKIEKYIITPVKVKNVDSNRDIKIHYLTYLNVCSNIKEYIDKKNTSKIITSFINMMTSISKIISELQSQYQLLGYWQDKPSEDIINKMREDKTYSLIKYANNSFLEDNIFTEIKNDANKLELDFGKAGPLISFKFKSKKNRLEGIQIQNKQFKYFIEGPSSISDKETKQFAQEHKPDDYNFSGKKEICRYKTKEGIFKYRYVKIESKDDLIKLINFFVKKTKKI